MPEIKIFFATDIHGSETVCRKFLNAAQVYRPDVMMLGGDLTGRSVVPLIKFANGKTAFTWQDKNYTVSESEAANYEKQLRAAGAYPYPTTPDQMAVLQKKPAELKRTYRELVCFSVQKWMELVEERLAKDGIECYFLPGNDDDLMVEDTFYNAK